MSEEISAQLVVEELKAQRNQVLDTLAIVGARLSHALKKIEELEKKLAEK